MTVGIELAFKAARHIAAAGEARSRHGPRRSQAAYTGPAHEEKFGLLTAPRSIERFFEAFDELRINLIAGE